MDRLGLWSISQSSGEHGVRVLSCHRSCPCDRPYNEMWGVIPVTNMFEKKPCAKHHCHDKFTLKCTESWIKSQLNLSMTVCQCKRNSKNCTTRRTLSWQCTHWNRFGIAKLHLQLWPIAIKRELRLPRFCQHMPFRMQRTIILCSHKPSS